MALTSLMYKDPHGDETIITVGTGATLCVGSDRYPYTVVGIQGAKQLRVQKDEFQRTDANGQSESQTYLYMPDPKAVVEIARLCKNGYWKLKGMPLAVGTRRAYMDPCF